MFNARTSIIALPQPFLAAHNLNAALPNVGPHSHPPAPMVNVVIPSTIMGSKPDICAPQLSKSCWAANGASVETATAAVPIEATRLIYRRFRLRSKNLSHVRTSVWAEGSGFEPGVGEAVVELKRMLDAFWGVSIA